MPDPQPSPSSSAIPPSPTASSPANSSSEPNGSSSPSPDGPETRQLSAAESDAYITELLNGTREPGTASEPVGPVGPEDGDPGDPAPSGDANVAPVDISGVAEKLGMTPEELYKVVVPFGDGQGGDPVSLGELKDAYADREARTREIAEQTTALEARDRDARGERRILARMAEKLGDVSPDVMRELRDEDLQLVARDRREVLAVHPEFADPKVEHEFWANVEELVATRYGGTLTDFDGFRVPPWMIESLKEQIALVQRADEVERVRSGQARPRPFGVPRAVQGATKPSAAKPAGKPRTTAQQDARIAELIGRK